MAERKELLSLSTDFHFGLLHIPSYRSLLDRAKEAAGWSVAWVTLALLFNAGVYHYSGSEVGLEFLTGYLIEKALSIDNIFVSS